MPIYEYICPKCKIEFELMLTINQANSTALCPECYLEAEKLISGFACKTGSNIQSSPKPFRKHGINEPKKKTQHVAASSKSTRKRLKAKTSKRTKI